MTTSKPKRKLFTSAFWIDTAERAITTAAETTIGVVGSIQAAIALAPENISDALASTQVALAVATVAATTATSVLKCIVAAGVGDLGTPSLVRGPKA